MSPRLSKFLGLVLLFLGSILLVFIFLPVLNQELSYDLKLRPDYVFSPSAPSSATAEPELTFEKTLLIPKSSDFALVIPKIGVNEIVFPNVDSGDPAEYLPVLKKGVAHAKNSSFPGLPGPTFIFAHSTDSFWNISSYNAAFFLLRKLQTSDDIYIIYKGKQYRYRVAEKRIIDPQSIPTAVSSAGTVLILQTCYPPGTTLKRLLLFATPV